MDDSNDESNKTRQFHAVDAAFFLAFGEAQEEALAWAIYWFRNRQKAIDLMGEALDAIIDGVRPWPKDITLLRHLKWSMRSINANKAKKRGELQLRRLPSDEDPEPEIDSVDLQVEHCRSPEELYDDAEGTLLAERMGEEIFEMTTPGSIERGILMLARKENHKTSEVALALGVGARQVTRAKESLRLTKIRPVLAKYGLTDPKETKKNKKKTGEES